MNISEYIPGLHELQAALKGAPDHVISVVLIIIAMLCLGLAFSSNTLLKAAVAAWLVFP